MFDIGWSELLVIGVVALIVVGPKDLPRMFRTMGEVTGKARRMAREFQSAMSQAADDSGMGDITKDLRKIANPKKFGTDAFKDATAEFRAWTPGEADGTPKLSAEREAARAKIEAATGAKASARRAAEELDAAELADEPDLLPDPAAAAPAAKGPAKAKAAAKAPASSAATPAAKPRAAAKPKPAAKPPAAAKDPAKAPARPRAAAKPKAAATPRTKPDATAEPKS